MPPRIKIGRRGLILGLGVAIAVPLAAKAEQPGRPVIGFLSGASPAPFASYVAAARPAFMSAGSSRGRSRPTYRSFNRPSSSWLSI
jgi:hypothetical protein